MKGQSGAGGDMFSERMAELAPTLRLPAEQGSFFLPAEHLRLLGKLEHLSRYSHYIQIVLGVKGSGKSTLVKQLLHASQADLQVCHVCAHRDMNDAELIEQLIDQLDIDVAVDAGADTKLKALLAHGDWLADISRLFVIVIDDADQLDDKALNVLLNIFPSAPNPDGQPHIILFSNPLLAEHLNATSCFKEAVDARCHFTELKPLELDDISGFIEHQHGDLIDTLSAKQLESIHDMSFGLPGRISKAVEQSSKNRANIASAGLKEKAAAGWTKSSQVFASLFLAVAIMGLGVWFMPTDMFGTLGERVRVELPVPVSVLMSEENSASSRGGLSLAERLKKLEAELKSETENLNASHDIEVEISQPLTKPEKKIDELASQLPPADKPPINNKPNAGDRVQAAKVTTVKPDDPALAENLPPAMPDQLEVAKVNAEPAVIADTIEEKSQFATAKGTVANVSKPGTLVLNLPAPNAAVKQSPGVPKVDAAVSSQRLVSATGKTKVKKSQAKNSITTISSRYLREKELLSWQPSGYTLQVLGARKEKSVIDFIRSRSVVKSYYYFATIYKQKPWYVVVYGNFVNRDLALAAVASLPADLRKRKPWARRVQGVQDDIRRKAN